jgi:hypothetical protein
MRRNFGFALIASCISITATMLSGTSAYAGQPWSCMCDGQLKRTIASTYACESDLYKGSGRRVHQGFKLFVPACTRTQFRAWNRRACAKTGCTLVPR